MSALINRKLHQAQERLQAGNFSGAEVLCEDILRQVPRNPVALCLLGGSRIALGRARDAVPPLKQAIAVEPRHGAALEYLGLAHLMLGEYPDAERALREAANLPGAPASVFMRLGGSLLGQRRHAEAAAALRQALGLDPRDVDIRLNLGMALAQAGDAAAAREQFEAVLGLSPDHADALFNLGVICLEREELQDAARWFERVLSQHPRNADARSNLGIVLQKQGRLEEAVSCLREALASDPANARAANNLARTLALQGRLEEAREHYLAALKAAPGFTAAHEGLASVCIGLGRTREALSHLKATVEAEAGNAGAQSALAQVLFEAGELDEAAGTARRATELDPSLAAPYNTLASIDFVRGELDRAIATLEAGHGRTGDGALLGLLAHLLCQACDWPKWRSAWEKLAPRIEREAALGSPFWLLGEPTTAAAQLTYTRNWARARFGPGMPVPRAAARAGSPRIRVGYLSSDLQEHAAAYLVAEVLELHDRGRFEVFAYSHGPDDASAMRRRLQAACEHFVDISLEPDDVAAARMRRDELDLLVDLKGYTAGDRLTIMARRPCGVQLAWLGYPGTTGADFIDYLIADSFVIPEGQETAYSERVLRLPHCYQANDRKRPAAAPLARADYGLPADAFVFCCFNQTYKITPDVFGAWMRLLRAVPGSVLWLVDGNLRAKHNLAAAAQTAGVDSGRLIFAPRLPYAQHLARYRVADLALDTFPYTSHTTASDALWCGCPLVGLSGDTFASRVSGSILTAAGLSDLLTRSLADYERLAGQLANRPALIAAIRSRVAQARDASPLFDTPAFTRDLEGLFARLAADARASAA